MTEKTMTLAEVMSRQPIVNVGVIGHVAHGKSTFVKNISGTKTQRHSSELINNKTVYLGYANTMIYQCTRCPKPKGFGTLPSCGECGSDCILVNHISFIDCPGHDDLMATMLNGVSMMDYVILVIAANELFPRPQTLEHFLAAKMMKIKNLIVLQNKVDLVTRDQALKQYSQIVEFMAGHGFDKPIVIPYACHQNYNRAEVLHYMSEFRPPERDTGRPVRIAISRSFDVNPGRVKICDITGGVIGGTVIQGAIKVGDQIEIRPGIITKNSDGNLTNSPILTLVKKIETDKTPLDQAYPGGLIGLETNLDPFLTQKNRLVGQIAGCIGSLPDVSSKLLIQYQYLDRHDATMSKKDMVRLSINSGTVHGHIETKDPKKNEIQVILTMMTCIERDQLVAISKKIGNSYRLVAYGSVSQYW